MRLTSAEFSAILDLALQGSQPVVKTLQNYDLWKRAHEMARAGRDLIAEAPPADGPKDYDES